MPSSPMGSKYMRFLLPMEDMVTRAGISAMFVCAGKQLQPGMHHSCMPVFSHWHAIMELPASANGMITFKA